MAELRGHAARGVYDALLFPQRPTVLWNIAHQLNMGWAGSLLSFARDERVILVTIGLATFGVVSTMMTALTIIRDDNEIPPAEPKTQYITQDTEDALQPDTLEKLLKHPNYSIREVATKILCDRAINDPETTTYLLYGISKPDYDERMQCLRALALLTGHTMGTHCLAPIHRSRANRCRPRWVIQVEQRTGILCPREIPGTEPPRR